MLGAEISQTALDALKYLFLALLFLFLARVVHVVVLELRAPALAGAPAEAARGAVRHHHLADDLPGVETPGEIRGDHRHERHLLALDAAALPWQATDHPGLRLKAVRNDDAKSEFLGLVSFAPFVRSAANSSVVKKRTPSSTQM